MSEDVLICGGVKYSSSGQPLVCKTSSNPGCPLLVKAIRKEHEGMQLDHFTVSPEKNTYHSVHIALNILSFMTV
jgi:hypothetical protein